MGLVIQPLLPAQVCLCVYTSCTYKKVVEIERERENDADTPLLVVCVCAPAASQLVFDASHLLDLTK